MLSFSDIATYVAGQWKVISQALPTFIVAVLVCSGIVWLFARNHFFGRIETLRERLGLRDDQLANMERKLGAESPGDALVKLGELTAKVAALSLGKWDPLTDAKIENITKRLSALPKSTIQISLDNDAVALGRGVDKIFDEKLGWNVQGLRVLGGPYGLKINPDCEEARAIAAAFKLDGLEIEVGPPADNASLELYLGGNPLYLD